jgi:hypothetical protein
MTATAPPPVLQIQQSEIDKFTLQIQQSEIDKFTLQIQQSEIDKFTLQIYTFVMANTKALLLLFLI